MSTSRQASLHHRTRSRRPYAAEGHLTRRRLHFESLEDRVLLAADLIVTDIEMEGLTSLPDIRSGDSVRLDFDVKNQGSASTIRDVHMRWYWGPSEGSTANYIAEGSLGFINGLSPGEAETETDASWTIPALSPGEYWLTGVIDWDGRVAESSEGNNTRSESFTVLPPRLTWRDGETTDASLATTIDAGEDVWAHIEGDLGESFVIEIWEDDGATGDDKIFAFSATVGATGVGTFRWTVPWHGDDRNDPENAYYLFHDAFGTNNLQSFLLEVTLDSVPTANSYSTPLTYDWGASEPVEGVIDVTLARLDSAAPIDPTTRTWVVTHGRNGSFSDNNDRVKQLADTIVEAREGDQVLTLDWTDGASFVFGGGFTDFTQESWILPVATWAKHALTNYGFASSNVNLVGHSFGAVISAEIAAAFLGGVNAVLAIDPAEDPLIVASGSDYSTDDVVFGASNSNYSWSFYTPGIAGNEETPTTADEAFVVTGSEHSRLVDLVSSIIAAPVGTVSRYFDLDRLLAHAAGPWATNQYDKNGVLDSESGYEAVISSTNNGMTAVSMEFVEKDAFPTPRPGDYDQDGEADGADFLVWQRSFTAEGSDLPADGNFTETVDQGDLHVWSANFGLPTPPALGAAVLDSRAMGNDVDAPQLASHAIALDWFETNEHDSLEERIDESDPSKWLHRQLHETFNIAAAVVLENQEDFVAAVSERDEQTSESWLTDELLERIFG